ncbi:MAG: alpha/beta hydrolase, partial [Deltaproteobacteria bacterium]|nr:alpha/beta hydrolase [Deltaproteobacteria bacterium]
WEGTKRELVCVHGLTANCRCWDRIVAALEPACRVTAMDLRGRGLSDKPATGYAIERHVRDVNCVLADQGLEKVVLMGHSLGAYVSLAFAARYPDQVMGLILVDGAGDLSEEQWDEIEGVIKPSLDRLAQVVPTFDDYVAPLKEVPFLQPWNPFLDVYFRYEIEETEGGIRSRIHAEHIREEILHIRQFNAAPIYPGISCPVLILRATEGILSQEDLVLPEAAAEKMLLEIPNARCVALEGANHYSIIFQANEERDRAIQAFLKAL